MGLNTGLFQSRYILIVLPAFCLLTAIGKEALAQIRLDDPEWWARGETAGIAEIRKTADSIQIRTSSTPRPEASLFFPLGPAFDSNKYNLLEVTMRTGPRIHNFLFVFTHAQSELSYSFAIPIYHDGEFHTYLIPLDIQPLWREGVSELGLVWAGTHEIIEIKKLELRAIRLADRIRYQSSRLWFPEIVNPRTINAIGGPVFLDQSLTLVFILLFIAFLAIVLISYRYGMWRKGESSAPYLPHRTLVWFQPAFWAFMTLWIAYDLRQAYDHIQTLKSEVRYYLYTSDRPRHHLELDDFYDFLDFVEKVIPNSKGVGFYSGRLLFIKARYFLFPRRVYDRESNLDYIIIYQDTSIDFRDGNLMEKGKVIGDRLKLVGRFGYDAFILEKSND